jgi:hypothetical protein
MNEGRGISDINKIETNDIYKIFINSGYCTFVKNIMDNDVEMTFQCSKNYDSKFYKKNNKYYILISCPKNYNTLSLKSVITHELNHFVEIMNIDKKKFKIPNYNKIKKSLLKFNPKVKQLEFFKHLIYKTLDNEINANVSQTYTYLKNFNSQNKKYLEDKLKKYYLRQDYLDIMKFDVEYFKSDIKKNNISFDDFNNILIQNGVNHFLNFLNYDTDKYIDNWFKIIKSNADKLLKKQKNIIKEVIEDFNYTTDYPIKESTILNYKNYIKNSL